MWWMKKFRKRKVQSLLIFVVVGMCATLITGSAVILTSLTSVYEELAEETEAPDAKIYSRIGFGGSQYKERLEKLDCVKEITEIEAVSVTALSFENQEKDVFLDVCQMNEGVYGKIRVLSGNVDDLDEKSCLLPESIAVSVGVKVGDSVSVRMGEKNYVYKIAATYAEIYSAATQYTCDMLVQKLPDGMNIKKVYAVNLKEGVSCDELIGEYTKENDGIMDGYFRSKDDSIMNAELTELILGGILLGISSVVFLAILLIIGYIVKNCFAKDKRTIAIYKTIGYQPGQIRRIYITFYMSIIFSATVVGGLLSPLLSNSFIKGVYENIGGYGRISGLWQIVTCVLVINLAAFLMLFGETGRIGKMKPVEILNGNDEEIGKKKLKQSKKEKFNFSPAAMAVRMMKRDRKNTALLILTCIISLYIVNLSIVCLQNIDLIKGETNYYWLGIDKHDVTIESNTTKERFYEICDEVKKDEQVERAVKRNYDLGFAIPYHQTTSAIVMESYRGIDMPVLKGRNPENSEEVVVGNIYLKEFGIDVGDYLTVQLNDECKKDLLVVGTYQGFYNLGRGVKVLGSLLDENNVDYSYTQCSITLDSGTDKEAFMKELKQEYGGDIKVIDRKNLYSSIMGVVCDPQRAALQPFVIITILIGALNAFYIIYASNVAKRKKYTIYKSLGYTSWHLLSMNCIYVAIVVLISIAVAVPAFIILFPKVMVLAMSAFGFAEYKMVIEPATLLIINAGMLLVFLASACVAATEIFKNHIAQIMSE